MSISLAISVTDHKPNKGASVSKMETVKTRKITEEETAKYTDMWGVDDYSIVSPGEILADYFIQIVKPQFGASVLDVGAGGGAGSKALKKRGLSVKGFDLTSAGWKHPDITLLTGCVWRDLPHGPPFDYVYCCDMMEHIPTEFTALSISEMLRVGSKVFLSISFVPEFYGKFIQQELHLTVKPFIWWRDMMRELGTVLEARDLMGDGVFLLTR